MNTIFQKVLRNKHISSIKKIPFVNNFAKKLVYMFQKTAGNWCYPFISIGWMLASFLTRRRMAHVGNVSFSLPCQNWITHFRWYLMGKKEAEVIHYIDNYVKDGDIFFDIGANIGIFTLYATKKYKNLKAVSFEPEYSNLYLLKENILKNKLNQRVDAFSLGISDFVGLSKLHIQDVAEGAAAHTESKNLIEKTDEGYDVVWAEGISTVTLDYIFEELDIFPNVMKMDTDGNEVKILRGAKKVFEKKELRSLVIEIPGHAGHKRDECERILKEYGFKLEWAKKGETLNEIWVRV